MSRAAIAFLAVGSSPAQVDTEKYVIDVAQETSLGRRMVSSLASSLTNKSR